VRVLPLLLRPLLEQAWAIRSRPERRVRRARTRLRKPYSGSDMKCILDGHAPQLHKGHGAFIGGKYWVCSDCGKTEPYYEGQAPMMWFKPQQQMQAAEMGER